MIGPHIVDGAACDQSSLEQCNGGAHEVFLLTLRARVSDDGAIAHNHLGFGDVSERRLGHPIRLGADGNDQCDQQHPPAPFEQRLVTLNAAEKLRRACRPVRRLKWNWLVH
jgi:hypothetical protein